MDLSRETIQIVKEAVRFPNSLRRINEIKARSPQATLYYIPGIDMKGYGDAEPKYWLVTKQGLFVVFGMTGLVESAYQILNQTTETLFSRANAYGQFHKSETTSLDEVIDFAYAVLSDIPFKDKDLKDIFEWRAQRVLARFADFSVLYGEKDIVPEYSDQMVVVRVSEGCPRACAYCPEPGKFKLYDEEKIRENMHVARKLQLQYHAPAVGMMNEGFINASDILWHYLNSTGVDLLQIISLFKENFPEIDKIYSFVGVPTFNKVADENHSYLERLFNAEAINRVLVGIETFDSESSAFLGKYETSEQKKKALKKLLSLGNRTGVKVKAIVQIGMTGEGFYCDDRFVSSRDALTRTAEALIDVSSAATPKRPLYVLMSRYVHIPETPLAALHKSGQVVSYANSRRVDEEVQFFLRYIQQADKLGKLKIEDRYEVALQ